MYIAGVIKNLETIKTEIMKFIDIEKSELIPALIQSLEQEFKHASLSQYYFDFDNLVVNLKGITFCFSGDYSLTLEDKIENMNITLGVVQFQDFEAEISVQYTSELSLQLNNSKIDR